MAPGAGGPGYEEAPRSPVRAMLILGKSLSIVATILLMVAAGFVLRGWGFLKGEAPNLLSRLVTLLGLPCMMVAQLFRYYTRESLLQGLPALGIAYLAIGLSYAISLPVARLARIPAGRRGVFSALFTFGNTVFIGLPVNTALFGEEALPATLLYYVANTSLFWVLGLMGIQRDAGQGGRNPLARGGWKRLLTPSLTVFLLCGGLILLGLRPPGFLLDAAGYVSGIVTPLSLLFVGTMLCDMWRRGLRWQRGYGWLIAARFLLAPGLILLLMRALGTMPPLYQRTFLMQAAMPIQTTCAIVAYEYGADAPYATGAVTLTTLLSVLTIPLFAVLTSLL